MRRIDAAIAIVTRNQRILVCQRKDDDTFGGYWEFPGGKVEAGETLEQCLARELREEVAIEARPFAALPVIEYDYPHGAVRLHPFLCHHIAGEPRAIGCETVKWVEATRLAQ